MEIQGQETNLENLGVNYERARETVSCFYTFIIK